MGSISNEALKKIMQMSKVITQFNLQPFFDLFKGFWDEYRKLEDFFKPIITALQNVDYFYEMMKKRSIILGAVTGVVEWMGEKIDQITSEIMKLTGIDKVLEQLLKFINPLYSIMKNIDKEFDQFSKFAQYLLVGEKEWEDLQASFKNIPEVADNQVDLGENYEDYDFEESNLEGDPNFDNEYKTQNYRSLEEQAFTAWVNYATPFGLLKQGAQVLGQGIQEIGSETIGKINRKGVSDYKCNCGQNLEMSQYYAGNDNYAQCIYCGNMVGETYYWCPKKCNKWGYCKSCASKGRCPKGADSAKCSKGHQSLASYKFYGTNFNYSNCNGCKAGIGMNCFYWYCTKCNCWGYCYKCTSNGQCGSKG